MTEEQGQETKLEALGAALQNEHRLEGELLIARADLARLKAALEEARQLIFDDCADDARIHLAAALKGTSP